MLPRLKKIYTHGLVLFSVFLCTFLFPQPPERTRTFVTSRLLEMGFSMRHIYWAMEAAGTALWSEWTSNLIHVLPVIAVCCSFSVRFKL